MGRSQTDQQATTAREQFFGHQNGKRCADHASNDPDFTADEHERVHLSMVTWPRGEALGLTRLPKFADEVPVGIQQADERDLRKENSFVAAIRVAKPTAEKPKVKRYSYCQGSGASPSVAPWSIEQERSSWTRSIGKPNGKTCTAPSESTKSAGFQENPAPSLELIARAGLSNEAEIIDIGGGASRLVDGLIDRQFRRITVLDLSAALLRCENTSWPRRRRGRMDCRGCYAMAPDACLRSLARPGCVPIPNGPDRS